MASNCIVNVSIGGGWYPKGQKRLFDSLDSVGDASERYVLTAGHSKYGSPYADKVMAIYEAAQLGYDNILYLDCSITALRPLDDIWKFIENKGYYLYSSGANCAETCNDQSLMIHGYTRDEAEHIPECASNVIGVKLDKKGKIFVNRLADSVSNGSIYGCKWCSEKERLQESKDERFKYHRQDQSICSLLAYTNGWQLQKEGHFVYRWENENLLNDNIIFKLKGG